MELLFSVILLELIFVSAQYQSPCPGIFDYENDGSQLYGVIRLQPSGPASSIVIMANFTIAAKLPSRYVGQLELLGRQWALQRYNKGAPLVYRVHFPVTSPVPHLFSLVVNDRQICYGPKDYAGPYQDYVTTTSFWHMLYLMRGVNRQSQQDVNPKQIIVAKPNSVYESPGDTQYPYSREESDLSMLQRNKLTVGIQPYVVDNNDGAPLRPDQQNRPYRPNDDVYHTEKTTLQPIYNQFTTQRKPIFNPHPTQPLPPFEYNQYTTRQQQPQPYYIRYTIQDQPQPNYNRYTTQRQQPQPDYNRYTTQRQQPQPDYNQYTTQRQQPQPDYNQYTSQRQPQPDYNRYTTQQQPPPDYNPYTTGRSQQPPPDYNPYTTKRPPQPQPDFNTYTTERAPPPQSPHHQPYYPVIPSNSQSEKGFASVQCGVVTGGNDRQALIHHGQSYERGAIPWLIAIYKRTDGNLMFNCAGTLISDRHIVTAHCIRLKNSMTSIKDIVVRIGVYNLEDWSDDQIITRTLESAVIHESYNSSSLANDVAVFTLDKTVEYSINIRPACLWDGQSDLNTIVGAPGVVAGWGSTELGPGGRGVPKMVHVPVVSNSICRASNPDFHKLTSDTTLCAGGNGSGPCLGDSGGGLYILDSGRWRLRGVVSVSLRPESGENTCDFNQYTVFTDVAKYNTWIKKIVKSSQI